MRLVFSRKSKEGLCGIITLRRGKIWLKQYPEVPSVSSPPPSLLPLTVAEGWKNLHNKIVETTAAYHYFAEIQLKFPIF